MSRQLTERVHFKLIIMPCCGHNLCWVNPRYPTFCPECGKLIFNEVKQEVRISDADAILTYKTGEENDE
jgi:hypothetical protein